MARLPEIGPGREPAAAEARWAANGHKGGVVWLTGLSGAGKSTLAVESAARLLDRGYRVYVLDGDIMRKGLCSDLSFSPEDRSENIRRVGEVAHILADAGPIAIAAFISPYRADRARARAAGPGRFHEVHVKADLEVCESRDPKGLYKKARAGLIPDFTGVSAPYEPPLSPELVVDTAVLTVEQAVDRLVAYIEDNLSLRS